ncbi:MAG: hypothetical protein K6F61_06485 [Clostridiales bacterium]|nr:hypothetical protein [Clostridiales bacterium]
MSATAWIWTKVRLEFCRTDSIRAIQRDYEALGEELWDRFNQKKKEMHGWYYGSLAKIFLADPKLKDTQACREYADRVKAVFGEDCIR